MPLGSAMTGVVRDALSGAPLLGHITIFGADGNPVWFGGTDQNGGYESAAWFPGTYYIEARAFEGPQACAVYLDRSCPNPADTILSVGPTPIALQLGEVRSGIDFYLDTNELFRGTFETMR